MVDRPEGSRPAPDVSGGWKQPEQAPPAKEGGWFVPENAVTSDTSSGDATSVPIPDNPKPEHTGAWYVPPDAAERAAKLAEMDSSAAPAITSTTSAASPGDGGRPQASSAAPSQNVSANVPQGAMLSTEIDY